MLYFAYGSSMLTQRLQRHVPSVSPCGAARLSGHAPRFHKQGVDGSAKCNVVPHRGEVTWGVLFDVPSDQAARLDRAQGVGLGYRLYTVTVQGPSERVSALTYRAQESAIDASLRPYRWYKRQVIAGAKQHQLPDAYIDQLRRVTATADSNRARARRNRENWIRT